MRLASKIFLGFSLVIVVLAAVGVLRLRAMGRLVSVNGEIGRESLPALNLTTDLRDTLLSMARLEERFVVLRDRRYADRWRESAEHARTNLARLQMVVRTSAEGGHLDAARRAFEIYHAAVAAEQTRLLEAGGRSRAGDPVGRQLIEQVETQLDALQQATHARIVRAQREAARLEQRTWTGVVAALATALLLALVATAMIALRITRSLRRLSAATASVAAGSFREPIVVTGRDEVAVLANAFNTMATRLRQHEQMKEEFFATLSHELRSPITSVREAAHLL